MPCAGYIRGGMYLSSIKTLPDWPSATHRFSFQGPDDFDRFSSSR
jgi:hypothetical protein